MEPDGRLGHVGASAGEAKRVVRAVPLALGGTVEHSGRAKIVQASEHGALHRQVHGGSCKAKEHQQWPICDLPNSRVNGEGLTCDIKKRNRIKRNCPGAAVVDVCQPKQGVAVVLGNITRLERDHLLNEGVELDTMLANYDFPTPHISEGFGKQMRGVGSRVAPETAMKGWKQSTDKEDCCLHPRPAG